METSIILTLILIYGAVPLFLQVHASRQCKKMSIEEQETDIFRIESDVPERSRLDFLNSTNK